MLCFGHLADSNVHIFVRVGDRPFPQEAIDEVFYAFVRDWNGSISAEIGIGLKKRKFLPYSRSKEELALMRLMKQALDPEDRMNPTKVFLADN
jgi:FAD/FMN-containing dehydrogenase